MEKTINQGRLYCFSAFKKTLDHFRGKPGISEANFRDEWLKNISQHQSMTKQGWYSPPPYGMAVLFADDSRPERINFQSLRDKEYFPSEQIADWNSALIYAYASNVDKELGLAGDFGVTLYFGSNPSIIQHYQNCHKATMEVLSLIESTNSSVDLFKSSQNIFSHFGLQNCIVSYTDREPLDLGHSIPLIDKDALKSNDMTDSIVNFMKTQRRFINSSSDWQLDSVEQFTIEPRLKSVIDRQLPQISFHYLVSKKNSYNAMTESDSLNQFIN